MYILCIYIYIYIYMLCTDICCTYRYIVYTTIVIGVISQAMCVNLYRLIAIKLTSTTCPRNRPVIHPHPITIDYIPTTGCLVDDQWMISG